MSEQQEAFIETLLHLAERDVERAQQDREDASKRAVALWMASEVERQTEDMSLPAEVSRKLREEAKRLRDRVRSLTTQVAA